jgi:hypothetical protein
LAQAVAFAVALLLHDKSAEHWNPLGNTGWPIGSGLLSGGGNESTGDLRRAYSEGSQGGGGEEGGDQKEHLHRALTSFAVLGIFLLTVVAFTLPAHVLLVRAQASLLPEADEPIVPFDRSFGGRVTPLAAGGPGYATLRDAWFSFPRAAWRRLLILYCKVALIIFASEFLVFAFFVSEFVFFRSFATTVPPQ